MTWQKLYLVALLLPCLPAKDVVFDFQSSPQKLGFFGTKDFSLQCSNPVTASNDLARVEEIRLLKEEPSGWVTIAYINGRGQINHTLTNVVVQGQVDPPRTSHLSVVWNFARSVVLGIYKCDVIGFTSQMAPVVFMSHPLVISQQVHPAEPISEGLKSWSIYLTNQLTNINTDLLKTQVELSELLEEQKKHMFNLAKWENATNMWPEGSYAVLATNYGCPSPSGNATWQTGSRTHHTSATSAHPNQWSSPSHLKLPIQTTSGSELLITQHFCTISNSMGNTWPRGSYCLNRASGHQCPQGFREGHIFWDDADLNNINSHSGLLPSHTQLDHDTGFEYCCRNDGFSSTPIFLPTDKPFFLYRYSATCQNVVGMSAHPETLSFFTSAGGLSQATGAHPDDGTTEKNQRLTLQLCHYEKL